MPLIPVTTKPVASPVSSVTLPPAPGGMNLAQPANEIADTQAVYLQDILLDQPGYARRRGPITAVTGAAALARPAMGLASAINPQGSNIYAALTAGGGSGYLSIWSANLSSVVDVAWPTSFNTAPYPLVDAGAALMEGTMIGTSTAYDANAPTQALGFWGGGTKANYSTGTISYTRGSTTVTGTGTAFTTGLAPGMWILQGTSLIGQVKSITNDTTAVLTQPAGYTASGVAYTAQSLRGVYPKVGKGTVTGSGTTLSGGNTKFLKQGLNVGTWNIYRQSDLAWVGTVQSVQSDIGLTLAATAAVPMADDAYVAVRQDADYTLPLTTSKPGFLTAVYAGRQWYANNGSDSSTVYRLWFSDPSDPEILDMTLDGDWLPVNSTSDVQESIVGLGSSYNALVVMKETETFAVMGSDPTSFDVIKIADDGTFSPMSVQQYGGGVIWTGREGVHSYDGTQVTNLTGPVFGTAWREMIETFNPTTHRMWSMIERNHYIVHIEGISPPVSVEKGNTSHSPDHWVVVVNLLTGAVTLWQNVKFRGAVSLPAAQQKESRFIYNDGTKGVFSEASAFFDLSGNDPTVEGVANAGPDFYFLSKKIDGGNPTRLKRFTYFILNYLIAGDTLEIDTVLGLNTIGTTSAAFPITVPTWDTLQSTVGNWQGLAQQFAFWQQVVTSVFVPDRVRFLKKSQFMQMRFWQKSNSVTNLWVGDLELGFKPMRPGRI